MLSKVARLSVFVRPQPFVTQPSTTLQACQQFVTNILFDRNLVRVIEDFLAFPLLAPSVTSFHEAPSVDYHHDGRYTNDISIGNMSIHPVTGQLWATDFRNRSIYVYDTAHSKLSHIRTITCIYCPCRIRIGRNGLILIVHEKKSRCLYRSIASGSQWQRNRTVSILDESSEVFSFFLEKKMFEINDIAINDKLQQIIVAGKRSIEFYSFDGKFIRKIKFDKCIRICCWNETESLLYLVMSSTWYPHEGPNLFIFDVIHRRMINAFSMHSLRHGLDRQIGVQNIMYNEYTKELFLQGFSSELFIWNMATFSIREHHMPTSSSDCNIAFKEDDHHHQVFSAQNNTIVIIQTH